MSKSNIVTTIELASELCSNEIDSIDKEIILLVTQGCTSSYSIWSTMEKNADDDTKVLAYKNINKRAINLSKAGYLEEIRLDLINMHGRKDYKVTMKGMKQLYMHIIAHPQDVKSLIEYMDKIKLNKQPFVNRYIDIMAAFGHTANLIGKCTGEELGYEDDGTGIPTKIYHRSAASASSTSSQKSKLKQNLPSSK